MNSSRRKLAAFLEALGVPPSARRQAATPAAPACESLEGRQLLAGGLGMAGMGMAAGIGGMADVSASHMGFDHRGAASVRGGGHGPGALDSRGGGVSGIRAADHMGGTTSATGADIGIPAATTSATSGTTSATSGTTSATGTSSGMGADLGIPGSTASGMGGSNGSGQAGGFGSGQAGGFGSDQAGGFGAGMGMAPMDQGGRAGFDPARGGFGQDSSTMDGGRFGGQGSMVPGMGTGTGSTSSVDTSQLQTDFQKLRTDSQAIHDKSQVTPAMEATVRDDIKAIKGAETTTPSQATLTTLQDDTKTAQSNAGGPTDAQVAQVQTDQDAVYASQGVNAALISKLDTDRAAIKTASGVTSADEATLAADKVAIQADLGHGMPSSTTSTSTTASTSSSTASTTPSTTASTSSS